MGSPSFPQKSGSNDKTSAVEQLLSDGFATSSPSSTLDAVAEGLRKEGLIETHQHEFVRCADPQDPDYPPKNRHCQGQIYLDEALDEGGHEFRCPECERPVFPRSCRKRRHTELQSKVRPEGVKAFITSKLTALSKDVRLVADGVYRVDIGTLGVFVCLADYCPEQYLYTAQ